MNDIAIRVENLSKQYRIGRAQQCHDTLRDALAAAVRTPLERLRRNPQSAIRLHLGLERRLLRGETGRSRGHHRAQRGGEDPIAQDPLPHHQADGGPRHHQWPGGLAVLERVLPALIR